MQLDINNLYKGEGMAKNVNISIKKRDFSVNARKLRTSGKIPATIYGRDFKSLSVQVDAKSFINAYKQDKTTIFDLHLDNDTYKALVKTVQYDNVSGEIYNIEFNRVLPDEKVKITVPVEIIGESPAVKAGGVVWNPLTEIEVECLPKDIPSSIKVDISKLENIEDAFKVEDIKYPEGVNAVSGLESIVVKINPKTAEEVTVPEEAPETIQ
jgi:large subunit ribosomal protein L25